MWNEEDVEKRAQHIKEAWADSGRYVDPARHATGHAALNEMVEVARGQFPGFTLRRSSGIEAHHDHRRFAWQAVAPDGSVPLAGIDLGVLSSDRRLQQITGFVGDLPQRTPRSARTARYHVGVAETDNVAGNPGNRRYHCSSGQIEISVQTEEQWHALAVSLGRPELAYRGAWEAVRRSPPDGDVARVLEEMFEEDPAEVWAKRLEARGVPYR
jgi:hypothetical protein